MPDNNKDPMIVLLVTRYGMTPEEAQAWVKSLGSAPDPGVIRPGEAATKDAMERDRWARYAQQIQQLPQPGVEPSQPWQITRPGMAGMAAERLAKGQSADHLMNAPQPQNRGFSLSVDGNSGPPLPVPQAPRLALSVDGTSGPSRVPTQEGGIRDSWDAFKARLINQMASEGITKKK